MTSRACGLRATGSSPRVRGTLAIQQARCARIRIIPACAGNSVCEAKPTSMGADHPRVCGELAKAATRNSLEDGSSPRVRGTPVNVRDDAHLARIIPACAGNSTLRVRRLLSLPDHPRVCGELAILSKEYGGKGGSSPRVRGTRWFDDPCRGLLRIIPACAGNSIPPRPSGCGSPGSSPRVRGTRKAINKLVASGRIIPACAGNSASRMGMDGEPTDHPRVCGELPWGRTKTRRRGGSSPRVRGTQRDGRRCEGLGRIIPACAGNSYSPWMDMVKSPDHPRVCGELLGQDELARMTGGSSPRVRGTLLAIPTLRSGGRIIPACAGNSALARAGTHD